MENTALNVFGRPLKSCGTEGNDLSTPMPEYDFPGLKPGDRWCLCALRWLEAYAAGKAPKVDLEATHLNALGVVSLNQLHEYAFIATA